MPDETGGSEFSIQAEITVARDKLQEDLDKSITQIEEWAARVKKIAPVIAFSIDPRSMSDLKALEDRIGRLGSGGNAGLGSTAPVAPPNNFGPIQTGSGVSGETPPTLPFMQINQGEMQHFLVGRYEAHQAAIDADTQAMISARLMEDNAGDTISSGMFRMREGSSMVGEVRSQLGLGSNQPLPAPFSIGQGGSAEDAYGSLGDAYWVAAGFAKKPEGTKLQRAIEWGAQSQNADEQIAAMVLSNFPASEKVRTGFRKALAEKSIMLPGGGDLNALPITAESDESSLLSEAGLPPLPAGDFAPGGGDSITPTPPQFSLTEPHATAFREYFEKFAGPKVRNVLTADAFIRSAQSPADIEAAVSDISTSATKRGSFLEGQKLLADAFGKQAVVVDESIKAEQAATVATVEKAETIKVQTIRVRDAVSAGLGGGLGGGGGGGGEGPGGGGDEGGGLLARLMPTFFGKQGIGLGRGFFAYFAAEQALRAVMTREQYEYDIVGASPQTEAAASLKARQSIYGLGPAGALVGLAFQSDERAIQRTLDASERQDESTDIMAKMGDVRRGLTQTAQLAGTRYGPEQKRLEAELEKYNTELAYRPLQAAATAKIEEDVRIKRAQWAEEFKSNTFGATILGEDYFFMPGRAKQFDQGMSEFDSERSRRLAQLPNIRQTTQKIQEERDRTIRFGEDESLELMRRQTGIMEFTRDNPMMNREIERQKRTEQYASERRSTVRQMFGGDTQDEMDANVAAARVLATKTLDKVGGPGGIPDPKDTKAQEEARRKVAAIDAAEEKHAAEEAAIRAREKLEDARSVAQTEIEIRREVSLASRAFIAADFNAFVETQQEKIKQLRKEGLPERAEAAEKELQAGKALRGAQEFYQSRDMNENAKLIRMQAEGRHLPAAMEAIDYETKQKLETFKGAPLEKELTAAAENERAAKEFAARRQYAMRPGPPEELYQRLLEGAIDNSEAIGPGPGDEDAGFGVHEGMPGNVRAGAPSGVRKGLPRGSASLMQWHAEQTDTRARLLAERKAAESTAGLPKQKIRSDGDGGDNGMEGAATALNAAADKLMGVQLVGILRDA